MPGFPRNRNILALSCLLALALSGCSSDLLNQEEAPPLSGERLSILELQRSLEPESATLDAQGFIAPDPWRNEFWPQEGGYPNHAMQHVALNAGPLEPLWRADIGDGSTQGLPLNAQPIIVDGKVFTLDSRSRLTAFDTVSGKKLWRVTVRPKGDKDPVISGGIAYSRGQLFVTSGFGEVLALSPENGSLIWRAALSTPSRAAPTVIDDRLFITTLDNRLLALSTEDGQQLWEFAGLQEDTGLVGSPSPAASRGIVIPAFSSGEIFALRVENGSVSWGENLSAFNASGGLGALSDIQALPVADKGLIIAISYGGRIMAIDERTGSRIWQREIGSAETPWVAGNHIFLITTENELVALGRDTGHISWVTPLPRYEDNRKKNKIYYSGPILAGGRLIIAGTQGEIIEASPDNGEIIRRWDSGHGISMAPVVSGEILYLLADDGTLMAYK